MRFTLNRAGVDQLAKSPGVAVALSAKAVVVAGAVAANAPRHTGDFAGSIRVTPVYPTLGGVGVTVFSTDFAAHIIEYGSVNNPAYSPFRRAAAALRLVLRGGGARP